MGENIGSIDGVAPDPDSVDDQDDVRQSDPAATGRPLLAASRDEALAVYYSNSDQPIGAAGSDSGSGYADGGGAAASGAATSSDQPVENGAPTLTAYYFWWYSPNSGDFYYGTAYDDGSYGYYEGETVYGPNSTTQSGSSDGYYYIYGHADATASGYAVGDVVGTSYYHDGSTDTWMVTEYGAQGTVTGASGLGSESDYAITSSGGYSAFGGDYYEADNSGLGAYYFYWYSPNSGDYYYGVAYDDGTYGYYLGETYYGPYSSTESGGGDGYYHIYDVEDGTGSGYSSGYVVTGSTYYDGDTGTTMATWYGSQGIATGAYGLSSEYDYAVTDSGSYDSFGHDYYEAYVHLTAYYFCWTSPNSNDMYCGTVYDDGSYGYYKGEWIYGPNSSTQTGSGDGDYYIYDSADASGSSYAAGIVTISVYQDVNSLTDMTTYSAYYGTAAGTSGLGSEYDWAITYNGSYDFFGLDYYEADNLVAYDFYWYSPNSHDGYYGTVYDDGTYGYYVGEIYYGSYSSTEAGSGDGYYYIYSGVDTEGSAFHSTGNVVVSSYYDADTGSTMSTWYGGQQDIATGADGLGSEYDWAITYSGSYDFFGEDYYEAYNVGNLTAFYFYWSLAEFG